MREGSFRSDFVRVAGVAIVCVLAALGCGGTPPGTGCDRDEDCPDDEFCGVGGCQAECRADRDCLRLGTDAVCAARGRCQAGGADAGMDGGGSTGECTRVCDDGVYCNGAEQCQPMSAGADPDGCVTVPTGCGPGECDELADQCEPCRDPDDDDDGFDDMACPGGTDCDDTNARVSPAARELCDDASLDEDCNPTTMGAPSEDSDSDGFWPATNLAGIACCNGEACGQDCADIPGVDVAARDRFPGARETCNELDDDCNGNVDEGTQEIFYRDEDCDGFGIRIPEPIRESDGTLPPEVALYARLGCPSTLGAITCTSGTPGWVRDRRDCNDSSSDFAPGRIDICDTAVADEDCDGTANDGCGCSIGVPTRCGPATDMGACSFGSAECRSGVVSDVCTGAIYPNPETCVGAGRGVDEDCDGNIDEGIINPCGQCTETLPPELCDGVDNDCRAPTDPGECARGTMRPITEPYEPSRQLCGAPIIQTCTARDAAYCHWTGSAPNIGLLGYSYFGNSADVHHGGCSYLDGRTDEWTVRNRPDTVGGCLDFIASPNEGRLPGGQVMVATAGLRWDGCVRFQVEVMSDSGSRLGFREDTRCGSGGDFFNVTFTTPPRSFAQPCPRVRIWVRGVDIPSSQLWLQSFFLTAG